MRSGFEAGGCSTGSAMSPGRMGRSMSNPSATARSWVPRFMPAAISPGSRRRRRSICRGDICRWSTASAAATGITGWSRISAGSASPEPYRARTGSLTLSPARRESLALIVPTERWSAHDGRVWRCGELWLPSFGAVRGSVRPEPLAWLRRVLAERLGLGAPAGTRLYVSRGDAGFRRLVNEPAVIETLARFGFEAVALTGMSFARQAQLFHDAAIVVAPHGAGLADLVLARPGIQVVELLPPHGDGVLRVYHTLAMVCGQRWLGVKCPSVRGPDGDFSLDPSVLDAILPSLS